MNGQSADGKGNGTNGQKNGHKMIALATPRDFLAIMFRQRRVIVVSFVGVFLAAAFLTLFRSDRYRARMLFFVQQERANPVVTAQPNPGFDVRAGGVTEEELNSELQLLQSRDLLEQVVVGCGLDSSPGLWSKIFGEPKLSKDQRIARAVQTLANKLNVEVVRRTNVISVSYGSPDPETAVRVLRTLSELYLKKHVAVHRPEGAADFFQQETAQFRQALGEAEGKLVRFTREQGVVSAALETEALVKQLTEFNAMQGQTVAAIAETQQRIRALDGQVHAIAPRVTTQVRTSDNPQLIEQLKSTLLTLELKRTELLAKFDPSYRPVQEVETQIVQSRAALADAEKAKWSEETTDRDPNYEWVRGELTKARADLAGLRARSMAIAQTVRAYQTKAQWLEQQGIAQQDLVRNVKSAEENYLLYLRKHEEAQISNALDTRQILNVTVAEPPQTPVLPVHSRLFYVLLSGVLAGLASLGLAFVLDNIDPTFRTPEEVESDLNIPVLVSVPKKTNGRAAIHAS